MKKEFQTPELEVIRFDNIDIITASGEENEGEGLPINNSIIYNPKGL